MIDRALRHPIRASLWALVIAMASVVALASLSRLGELGKALNRFDPWWLILALVVELASIAVYALAYQRVVQAVGHRRLSARQSIGMVLMGFGTFAFFGGFALDRRGLQGAGADPKEAENSVLALGVIELAVLSGGVWIAAMVELLDGSSVAAGMLWPWVIAVPVTTAALFAISHRGRRRGAGANRIERFASNLESVFFTAMREPYAFLGIAFYFAADLLALYVSLRAFGVRIDFFALIVAYGSGFLFTRRTLPLASAGVVEVLLTASIFWVGAPLAPSIAAVFAFRVLNLGVIGMLGLPVRRALLSAYGVEPAPSRRRRRAARRSAAAAAAAAIVPPEAVRAEQPSPAGQ